MSEWADCALGDALTLQRGFDLPKRLRQPGPYPVVSSAGATGFHSKFKVDPPGIVIGRYGSLGSVHWVEEPFWPLNTALWVKDFKGNDARFLSYLLQTVAVDGSTASAVPGVNRNHLHKMPVRVPDVRTQKRIAMVLSAFDELIEINERRIALLEDLARSLYREWFVHFRFPGHEDVEFVNSELGPIPDGWTVHPLGDVAELTGGSSITKASYVPYGTCAFSAAGPDGFLPSFEVDGKGVVLSAVGARSGRTFRAYGRWSAIANTIRILPKSGLCHPSWLYLVTADSAIWPRRGSAQPFISINDARGVRVLVPPYRLNTEFEESVGSMFESVDGFSGMNRELTATRDLLLPRFVSGRRDISDIDLGALTPANTE